MAKEAYLDNNATTRPDPAVVEAMLPYLKNKYGNASSVHHLGVEAERAIGRQRRLLADFLQVNDTELYFTSGGTESNNLILQGVAKQKGKNASHIVTTAIEHSSVRDVIKDLDEKGFDITTIYPDEKGLISVEQIKNAVRNDTILVSVMHINNETGTIYPVEEIGKSIKAIDSSIAFHVDGVQAFGKYPVDLTHIDAYTISGHKIHAPKGIGALYVDSDLYIEPLIIGGGQESGMRSGTENVPGIVGFGKAAELMFEEREGSLEQIEELRQELCDRLKEITDIKVNTPLENSLPTTLNVSIPPIPGEVIVNGLSEEGIYISSGSACSSRKKSRSHVLKAMNLDRKYVESSVRFSFSRMNTFKDMNYACSVLKNVLPRLKSVAELS